MLTGNTQQGHGESVLMRAYMQPKKMYADKEHTSKQTRENSVGRSVGLAGVLSAHINGALRLGAALIGWCSLSTNEDMTWRHINLSLGQLGVSAANAYKYLAR